MVSPILCNNKTCIMLFVEKLQSWLTIIIINKNVHHAIYCDAFLEWDHSTNEALLNGGMCMACIVSKSDHLVDKCDHFLNCIRSTLRKKNKRNSFFHSVIVMYTILGTWKMEFTEIESCMEVWKRSQPHSTPLHLRQM